MKAGRIQGMTVKRRDVLDTYRSLKLRVPDTVYAFMDTAFATFYMADAHVVHALQPDVPIERERTDFCCLHRIRFQALHWLFGARGLRCRIVRHRRLPSGIFAYRAEEPDC